jgi:leucyl-tRNA synthetase
MGVPAHDPRDLAFAEKYQLPVKTVISIAGNENRNVTSDYGTLIESGAFTGLTSQEAMEQLPRSYPNDMEVATTYKLRDWLISRQRYWGAPIPIVYDPQGKPHPVKEEHLPWLLPTDVDFKPTGESPLHSSKEFIERTERLYGVGWRPEFDTIDTFVDSSWYYLRYVSARNEQVFSDPAQLADWLPVDFYMIGPEHIVLHLLYSRFLTKFLRDAGYLSFGEPFMKMRHQGMILGPDGKKMSKSKGNVINPDDVIEKFGADCLRMYEMFMGPIESDKPWNVTAVMGVYRFLQRIQSVFDAELSAVEDEQADAGTTRAHVRQKLHYTLEKVTSDIPALKFNTAIASLMELLNEWESARCQLGNQRVFDQDELSLIVRMLAPLAPFLSEELWEQLPAALREAAYKSGEHELTVHLAEWPAYDAELAKPASVVIPVQINGKIRASITISQDSVTEHTAVLEQALAHPDVQKHVADKKIVKQLYIAGKIVSLVIE